MRFKSEAKIGIIVLVTIALVVWGINYLKGNNILKRSDIYYTIFPNVAGLEKTAAIYINGYKIGLINDIHFEKGDMKEIIVSFEVHHDFDIPRGSVAELYSSSIVGSKAIRIIPSSSDSYYAYGDTLPSRTDADMITNIQNSIIPLTTQARNTISTADSILSSVNNVLSGQKQRELEETIANLANVSASLKSQLGQGGDLNQTLAELKKFSTSLGENKSKLDTFFTNLASVSDSIGKANIRQTLENINETFAQSSRLLANINGGEGTLGRLATNDSLYNFLKTSTQSLDLLLTDMREHPKRYVHFSVFGKKEKPLPAE